MKPQIHQPGLIICISGPSGVGKDTVIHELMRLRPGLCHSVSMTTRKPRGDEQEGVDYYFTTHERFEAMIGKGEILEYDKYCRNYYGTPRTPLQEMILEGQDVALDITISGTLAIQQAFPDAITIFLMPPSLRSLKTRLLMRGTETEEAIDKRLEQALVEIGQADQFQYIIVNDRLADTTERILSIITAEQCRSSRMIGITNQVIS